MTSAAPQRPAIGAEEALAELDRRAGAEFDPRVVHALANVIKETQHAIGTHPQPDRAQPPTSPPSQVRAVPA
jgi:HD-GYP domain-containing protein (c-di-GMP phosphodiesterase class II)